MKVHHSTVFFFDNDQQNKQETQYNRLLCNRMGLDTYEDVSIHTC